jgi:hypothetical protein
VKATTAISRRPASGDHVAFTWSFTTQPAVDGMVRLRDESGQGVFGLTGASSTRAVRGRSARWVLTPGSTKGGAKDEAGWQSSEDASKFWLRQAHRTGSTSSSTTIWKSRRCDLLVGSFGLPENLDQTAACGRSTASDPCEVVGTFKSPFLLEGGQIDLNRDTRST